MKASILIPAYNAAQYLEATLLSCVDQGADVVEEIVVVDDHSEDDSKAVFSQIANAHPEFVWKWLTNPNKGACSARNYALTIATGDWIQWLDADDLLGLNKMSEAAHFHKQHPSQLLACPWRPFSNQPGDKATSENNARWEGVPQHSSPSDWLAADLHMVPHCYSGERRLFEQAGPWDETLEINQDGEYFSRVVALSQGVAFSNKIEVHYRQSSTPSVSTFGPQKTDSLYRSTESMTQTGMAIEDSERMRQMVANRWQHFIYTTYPHRTDLARAAQNNLRDLPQPDIENPLAVSPLSKFICSVFGWKTLVLIRTWRNRLRNG